MEKITLPLKGLQITQSRYRFLPDQTESGDGGQDSALNRSLELLGMVTPLVVHRKTPQEPFNLVHGWARTRWAMTTGLDAVPCFVLPPALDPCLLLDLIFTEYRARILASPVSKARFVGLALSLGLDPQQVVRTCLPLLGLQAHPVVLEGCQTTLRLPEAVLLFAESKGMSMKQCVHFAQFPAQLLSEVLALGAQVNLSPSVMEELVVGLGDVSRRERVSVANLLGGDQLGAILHGDFSPQERTARLRDALRVRRYPVLTAVNRQMDAVVERMNLPQRVRVHWDRTLENRQVRVEVRVDERDDWQRALDGLNGAAVAEGIGAIWGEL